MRLPRLLLTAVAVCLACGAVLDAAPPGRKIRREPIVRESAHVASLTTNAQTATEEEGPDRASEGTGVTDEQVRVPRWMNLWREERAAAARRGFSWYLESSGEYYQTMKDPSGGHNRSYYHDAYLELSVDLKAARMGSAGAAFLTLVGGREHVFSSAEGVVAPSDEHTPADTNPGAGGSIQLYELWYERPVGKTRWLIGLRDISSDFCVLRFNDALTNGSFWFNQTVSANVPLGIYELTTLGVRLTYPLNERLQLATGLFEGTPGTAEQNPHGWNWRIGSKEGVFRITELQLHLPGDKRGRDGYLKVGNWYHSGDFADLRDAAAAEEDGQREPVNRRRNWGTYLTYDQQVYRRSEDTDAGLGIFLQKGWQTPNDRSSVESAWACGFTWTGPFRDRPSDALSVGLGRTTFSRAMRAFQEENEEAFLTTEEVVEVGYLYQLAPGLTLRPSLQFIKNVEGDPTLSRARYFSLRCTAVF